MGLKVSETVQDSPEPKDVAQVSETMAKGGVALNPVTVRLVDPEFTKVTDCGADVVPAGVSTNESEVMAWLFCR